MGFLEMLVDIFGPAVTILFMTILVVLFMILLLVLLWIVVQTASRWQAQAAFEQGQSERRRVVQQHIQDIIDYDIARDVTAGRETTEWKELEPVVSTLIPSDEPPEEVAPAG